MLKPEHTNCENVEGGLPNVDSPYIYDNLDHLDILDSQYSRQSIFSTVLIILTLSGKMLRKTPKLTNKI